MTRTQRFKIGLGAATLVVGGGLPFVISLLWGKDHLGVGILYLWTILFVPVLIFGCAVLYDGINEMRALGPIYRMVQNVSLVAAIVLLAANLFVLGTIAYHDYIGPRAELIFPDDFEGYYAVIIDEFTHPSLSTAGEIFTYEIPDDGILHVEKGWISAGFRTDPNDTTLFLKRSTRWMRRNGVAIRMGMLSFQWLPTNSGPHGIIGEVGAGDIVRDRKRIPVPLEGTGLLRFADSIKVSLGLR